MVVISATTKYCCSKSHGRRQPVATAATICGRVRTCHTFTNVMHECMIALLCLKLTEYGSQRSSSELALHDRCSCFGNN